MNKDTQGDREYPNCEQISLIEIDFNNWGCLNCNEVYSNDILDECEE